MQFVLFTPGQGHKFRQKTSLESLLSFKYLAIMLRNGEILCGTQGNAVLPQIFRAQPSYVVFEFTAIKYCEIPKNSK